MHTRRVYQRFIDTGVIAIARDIEKDVAVDVVEAVKRGGIDAIEITVDTPGAVETIQHVAETLGDEVVLGAGTVLDAETVRSVLLAGAEFIVTPTLNRDVIETGNRYGAPVIPGVMTPTEALDAVETGADFCKLFPASTVGPSHVQAINGPLPQIPLVPTGGVSLDNAAAFFEAGAIAVGVGSALIDQGAIDDTAYGQLTDRAAQFAAIAEESR